MNCPACGLLNPPKTLTCDCGYDFKVTELSKTPEWSINLAWRQKVAAYWLITWPASVGSFTVAVLLTSLYPIDDPVDNFPLIGLAGHLSFFGIQVVLTRRLVRKDFRSFRVGVLRKDGQGSRTLSRRETGMVWLWIFGPQLALLLTASVVFGWYAAGLQAETVSGISSLLVWLRFLVIGPYAVDLALRAKYPGFRLQAYGYRHI